MNISKYFIILSASCIIFSSCSKPDRNGSSVQTEAESDETKDVATVVSKPIANVYIENSASMDGYVKGVTEFETIIYNYLTNIKISNVAKSLNLNYINSQVIKQKPDVEDFIQKLEPTTFKLKGGNRGTTDISDLIKTVLKETTGDNLSIVVSDFIFSPGRNRNADDYLTNQKIGIKSNIAEYLKEHSDAAVCIYQFSSKFDGTYYNRVDSPTHISSNRPFYVWVIGKKSHIKSLREKVDVKFSSELKNSYILEVFNTDIKYNVVASKYCKKIKYDLHACEVEKDRNDQISFSVDMDLSNSIMDENYLCNPSNYVLSDSDMSIVGIKGSSSQAYTHTITFASNRVKPQTLSVSLKSCMPQWVDDSTDSIGLDIRQGNAMSQTYGLKHLITGVYEAFTFNGDTCFRMNININR